MPRPVVANWSEEQDLCDYAKALLPRTNRNFMDEYLIGPINSVHVAKLINHNNLFHHGNTTDQMVHLSGIIEARAQSTGVHLNKLLFYRAVKANLAEIQRKQAEFEASLKNVGGQVLLQPLPPAREGHVQPNPINPQRYIFQQTHITQERDNSETLPRVEHPRPRILKRKRQ
ncbi:hypothetical protein CAEBREN_17716 [Caenorhabditis brenneri]|uniref:Uncharacterized protein n=1 Tax=Caenorhabditis brenneri TaxID=135651 RepID=G0MYI9_CAEBE|nr:hypothetical protein CAEBREN_17716 [Caenorhabditis brenneri]